MANPQPETATFRSMRRTKQALPREEIERILRERKTMVLALAPIGGYPYAVPVNYVYHAGKIYFHCAAVGQKIDCIRANPKVSLCIIDANAVDAARLATDYRSVIVFGTARILADDHERFEAARAFGLRYNPDAAAVDAEIKREWSGLAVVEVTIDHCTGKEGRRLAQERESLSQRAGAPFVDSQRSFQRPVETNTADTALVAAALTLQAGTALSAARAPRRAIVFDLDGTLLDTLGDLAASVNATLRAHGYPERTVDDVRRFVGNGVKELIRRSLPDGVPVSEEEAAAVLRDYKAHYAVHGLDSTRPYDGVPELLFAAKAAGYALAVVSNKQNAMVETLSAHFFGDTFAVAIGEDMAHGVARKPDPSSVFEALKALGVEPQNAVYVGDSEVDIETARNAGLPCVSVTWGFRERAELVAAGADILCEHPQDLLALCAGVGFRV